MTMDGRVFTGSQVFLSLFVQQLVWFCESLMTYDVGINSVIELCVYGVLEKIGNY